ncbi:hypothetical protein O181_065667 [Austropuccinia psidii MF-1]|uniref:Uncharacterized protein n=1 Tax=Austropuccinia psidii MF-1 TaxID=1389203 RepID=A0A9Q3ETX3_9BASI|nr:hypothetical protein [Austropuccinia psidii MF-1]
MKCSKSYFVSSKDPKTVGCLSVLAAIVYCPKDKCLFTVPGSSSTPDVSFENCSIGNNKNFTVFPTSYTVVDQKKTITVFTGDAFTKRGTRISIPRRYPATCTWATPSDHNAQSPVCAHCTHSPP